MAGSGGETDEGTTKYAKYTKGNESETGFSCVSRISWLTTPGPWSPCDHGRVLGTAREPRRGKSRLINKRGQDCSEMHQPKRNPPKTAKNRDIFRGLIVSDLRELVKN